MSNTPERLQAITMLLLCGVALAAFWATPAAAQFGRGGIHGGFARPFAAPRNVVPPRRGIAGRPPGRGRNAGSGIIVPPIIVPPVAGPAPVPPGPFGGSAVPPRGEQRFVTDEVLTVFSPNATPQAIAQLARRYDLTEIEVQELGLLGGTVHRWHVNGRRLVADLIGALENERLIASVQPNYLFSLQESPPENASGRRGDAAQYVLDKLEVAQAHHIATGRDVRVAVIDTEIDARAPDLGGAVTRSFDALGGEDSPRPHGTAMAGAIAAHGKLLGIAPDAQLLAARAFDDDLGKGTSLAIYKALQWAADNAARVVNMSFAGPPDPGLHRMLAAAYTAGMVLIAPAGNGGPNAAPLYPGSDPSVIAVTATDSHDALFAMANRGSYIACASPGVDILAVAPNDSYQVTTGTSVAAAHVSGIAALLLEHEPSLKPDQIRAIIARSATPLGSPGASSDFGSGLVDAYRAVMLPDSDQSAQDRTQH